MKVRRPVAVAALAALAAIAAAWLAGPGVARSRASEPVLHVGDTVRIAGTSTRCAVARRSGAVTVECLPVDPKAGSYATLAGDRDVFVVRFRSPHVAKTVFHARQHHLRTVTCR
jgi:hypothetical protein